MMNVGHIPAVVKAADLPLERLAGNTQVSEPEKITEASRQFEAILLRQVLTEAQKTAFKSKYTDESVSSSIYRDMTVQNLADGISRSGGLGLAKVLNQELTRQSPAI